MCRGWCKGKPRLARGSHGGPERATHSPTRARDSSTKNRSHNWAGPPRAGRAARAAPRHASVWGTGGRQVGSPCCASAEDDPVWTAGRVTVVKEPGPDPGGFRKKATGGTYKKYIARSETGTDPWTPRDTARPRAALHRTRRVDRSPHLYACLRRRGRQVCSSRGH